MQQILSFLRANALFVSMLIGAVFGLLELEGYWPFLSPAWVLPFCIFLMLFFTFLRMDPLTLRLHPWHGVILIFQIVVSLLLFFAVRRLDTILAQGLFICVLMPSATAAPIIAGKLGGNVTNLTAYTLLSNALTAVLVPILFPLVNSEVDLPFWFSFWMILKRISPLLIVPFLSAWCLRIVIVHGLHRSLVLRGWIGELPFLLWTFTLTILTAKMTRDLAAYEGSLLVLAAMFAGALVVCLMQFYFGKWIGERLYVYSPQETRVTAGQALGQKNTTLAIWLAGAYLNPVSALAPAAYIIWQNLFNSWQLSRAHRHRRI